VSIIFELFLKELHSIRITFVL